MNAWFRFPPLTMKYFGVEWCEAHFPCLSRYLTTQASRRARWLSLYNGNRPRKVVERTQGSPTEGRIARRQAERDIHKMQRKREKRERSVARMYAGYGVKRSA